MKTNNSFLTLFIVCLGLILSICAPAQTFTVLHNFSPTDPGSGNNSEGSSPLAGLILSGNTLYGAAIAGGSSGHGTVFSLGANGTGFTNLHNFAGYPSDGANPPAGVILSGSTLYGTANNGGTFGNYGTVFAVNTDSTGFTDLHSFSLSDGADLNAGVILSGDTLYGMTEGGGNSGWGTIFKIKTNATGFAIVHNFTAPTGTDFTNADGAEPFGGLVVSGNTLYGMTTQGGNASAGAIFSIGTDGLGITNLHSFAAGGYDSLANFTNSDGGNPQDSLILAGNTLYGTTEAGGSAGYGTVFAVNTNGSGFTTLHSFTALVSPDGTNSDGANPYASLILSGNTLYGTTANGGSFGGGTVFAINTDGTGFEILHAFTATSNSPPYGNSDGKHPAGLVLSGNTLYGTASQGGTNGNGTVFSISFPPPALQIVRSGANVILTWPTNGIGVNLQSATDLFPTAVWSMVSPASVVVNGQNTVTNLVSGTRNFYRLTQ